MLETKIQVKGIHSTYEEPVSVNVDGWCNHASTESEMVSYDTPAQIGQDTTEHYLEETCTRCGCYRRVDEDYPQDFDWCGIEQLPIIPAGIA